MGILDTYKGSDILKGLRGLKGLSDQERSVWERDNAKKIAGQSQEQIERIYANQQFIKRYGLNAFKSLDANQRDNIYRKGVINRAITNIYSPYTVNKKGQTVFDANKGVGNTATYEKIKQLSDESKIDLLNSEYKTTKNFKGLDNLAKVYHTIGTLKPVIGVVSETAGDILNGINNLRKESNDSILEGIISKDEKRKKEAIQPLIDDYAVKELGKVSDSQIKQDFYKAVKANGQFYAFFGDKPSEKRDEVKNFSIQDMRNYLSTITMYNAVYGENSTNSYATHFAQNYIADHRGLLGNAEVLLNDITKGAVSYAASKVNHWRQNLYDPYQPDSKVWVNTKGEVIDPDRIKSSNKSFYYIDGKGKRQNVHTTTMSRTALDYMGKDENGRTRSAFFNNQFMADAEQYGTFNWDEQRKYKEIGYSPYSIVSRPGENSVVYEGLKMSSFIIADGVEQLIPFGVGKFAKALEVANAITKVQKVANFTAKTANVASKILKGAIPTNNAFAIGHAYGEGAFGENIQNNLLKLEEKAKADASNNFKQRYNSDKQFRANVDSRVQQVYSQLKAEQLKQMKDGGMQITDKNLNDKLLRDKAKAIVGNEFISNEYKDIQSSKKYNDAIGDAASVAATGAMVASITDAAKYALVNNFGFRKFLTSSSEERAVASANKLIQGVKEGADKKLITPSSTLKLLAKGINKEKAKTLGLITAKQTWGGAWTNFTDEMQSWGGKQINEDAFTSYLNNQYDGDASDKVYGSLDYLNSYFKGAMNALGKSSTWNAGLVGGLGGFSPLNLNVYGVARAITTKEGRTEWNKSSALEKVNTIINNGVISDYYAKKYGAKHLAELVDETNRVINETDKLNALKKALALNRATMEVANENDKDALNVIKAVSAMMILHRFNNDPGVQEQHSNSILEKLKDKFRDADDASLRLIAQKSSVLSDALKELSVITNGELSKEETSEYLDEYYKNNPSIPRSEENDTKALQDIKENAQRLTQAEQQVNEVSAALDRTEEQRGSKISDKVRNNLIVKKTLDTFLGDRISQLEQKITGRQEVSESNPELNTLGGKNKSLKIHEQEITKRIGDLVSQRDKQKEEVDKNQKDIDEYKEKHSKDDLSEDEIIELRNLENKLADSQLQYQYLQNRIDRNKEFLERVQHFKDIPTRILSKDEILNLAPEERARMLDDTNRDNYTKEQLKIIDELKNDLILKDPTLLQDIQDVASLHRRKIANAEAYKMILENPEAAASRLESQEITEADIASNVMLQRYIDRLNKMSNKFYSDPAFDAKEVNDAFYTTLRQYKPSLLKAMKSKLERDSTSVAYAQALDSAIEWSEFTTEISKTIDTMELPTEEKDIFRKNIDDLIDKAQSKKEALDILNKVVDSSEVNDNDSSKFKTLLSKLTGVQKTKAATVIESEESKTKRQEAQKEKTKQEKNKVQIAEKKVEEIDLGINDEDSSEGDKQKTPTETKEPNEQNTQENTKDNNEKEAKETVDETSKDKIDTSTKHDTSSPNWDKQIEEAKAEGYTIENEGVVTKNTPDITDQGNITIIGPENMLGNSMYGYDVTALEEDAKEVERTGRDPNDTMSRFFKWFKTAGIKLQEIIDNEFNDIIKVNNKLEFLYINPKNNSTDDAALGNFSLLCVEYTDAVKKIHKEDRGGVITANGKQYLIVGTAGFARSNKAQGDSFRSTLYQGQKNRDKYFSTNSSERFYVDSNIHTEVEQMTSGRIVREMVGDKETKVRPITELLSDPNRNPKGLKLQDLKWGIMFEDGLHYVNISPRNTVFPPRDTFSNLGAVFLLIETANGNYIPTAIRPALLSDVRDGALKTQLNTLFNELTSAKYSDRLKAISQLVKLLYLSDEGENNILIGMEDKPTVSTVKNGVVLRTFNVAASNFNRMDLINAINELNPRVNITLSTLSDPVQLRMYAEAGALDTDIAKLGTSNASYTVYAMDENGNPIKTKPIENGTPNSDANSDLEKADYKKKHSIYHKGVQYREKNGKWYDINWKEVTEPLLLNQIKWANYIRANDLIPDLTSNDKYGNKNVKYYIINPDETNAKVLKVFENGNIAELNIVDSRTIINDIKQRELQAAREKAAKEEKEKLEKTENSVTTNTVEFTPKEEVDLGETLTDDQLIAQGNGDFTSTAKPQPTDSEVRAQEVVDKITTDTHDIVLDEKRSVYTDSTGKEYARVTSVIQATEGAERFDPDSPWILPSTKIGTGIDEFVRDFFAGKLGNLENLHERYPNASLPQLQAFEKQLRELKANFDKRGLTVVPRDVTVTGEVEVTDTNGKKYKLPVAGTLDLLAYDKDGNFYIFDMKTNRSAPNDKKATKWGKQLSLYKQFLEEKYGINVKGTEIIPIKVSYPSPYEVSYKAEGNQLSTIFDGLDESFRSSKPTLYPNIPIFTSPVKVEYNLLTNEERSMLSPIIDGTFNSTTGTTNKESVNKSNEDINKTGNKSLAELQASANANPTDANSILKNRTYSRKVREVLKEKGFNGKPSEAEAWLKEHNMPTSNINDIDAWIDMLQNCR